MSALKDGRADGACWVDRCASVVDAYEVDEDKRETDSKAGEVVRRAICLACRSEDNKDEYGCEDSLHDETVQLASRTSVGACRGATGKLRGCADKGVKDGCGDDGTAYLTADIAYEVFARCASGNVCADGYGWIDMAA